MHFVGYIDSLARQVPDGRHGPPAWSAWSTGNDGEEANPGAYRAAQIAEFRSAFDCLDPGIGLVCVCGNHDVGDHATAVRGKTQREKKHTQANTPCVRP